METQAHLQKKHPVIQVTNQIIPGKKPIPGHGQPVQESGQEPTIKKPTTPGQGPATPREKMIQKRNLRKQELIKKTLSSSLRSLSARILMAEMGINDDPLYLFNQIAPTLSKMGLKLLVDSNKTRVDEMSIKDNNRLYMVTLRRDAELTDIEISKMKSSAKEFEKLERSKSGEILVYVWGPYEAPKTL